MAIISSLGGVKGARLVSPVRDAHWRKRGGVSRLRDSLLHGTRVFFARGRVFVAVPC